MVDDFVLTQSEHSLAATMQDVEAGCRGSDKEDASVALPDDRHVGDLERKVAECAALDIDSQHLGG